MPTKQCFRRCFVGVAASSHHAASSRARRSRSMARADVRWRCEDSCGADHSAVQDLTQYPRFVSEGTRATAGS